MKRIDHNPSHDHKFNGKERESESGLDNFEARYYGSSLAWIIRSRRPLNEPSVLIKDCGECRREQHSWRHLR